jgi:hypothetical protein
MGKEQSYVFTILGPLKMQKSPSSVTVVVVKNARNLKI